MIVSFDEVRRVAFRALDSGGAAPGIDDECGWACAWLEVCGYPGLKMLIEALDETPREERRPSYEPDALGIDLHNISCIFSAPTLADLAAARSRIFLRNVKHGLYILPFTVRANIGIGCPVDPSFAVGGERHKNPYAEKLAAAAQNGVTVDDAVWQRACPYSRAVLVPESETSLLKGAGAGLTDND
jgi:phosphatidylserine/phosphatidylglycerophosphate/cardiolipin synthase-like enzyme